VKVSIDPISRLEGHGRIDIFLDEKGDVENAYFRVPELRGFEKFCMGRLGEEMPQLTSRICGVCPIAHHFAATKALDACYDVEPPRAARKLRELMYNGSFIYDHTLHFYFLGGPDFIVGPHAPKAERNILGVINKVGLEIGTEVIKHRAYGQRISEIIGGKSTHPVCGIPGGMSKPISEEERSEIEKMAESSINFARFSLKIFEDIVLKNKEYLDMILSDTYKLTTYNMGLVDEANKVNFYDGKIRVTDPEGKEFFKIEGKDYLNAVEERMEEWTYVKLPYLKGVGWKGWKDGKDSGIFRVGPLGRLNASEGMATSLAHEEFKKMYETLGRPVHNTLAFHWARLIELLYAAERTLELSRDPEITSQNLRATPGKPGEGIGVVEAARGTLIHHYKLDDHGLVEKANLIVATTNNAPAICLSVKKAAFGLIKNNNVSDGLLNMIEMAFRAYDPCFGCATHSLLGQMPLEVKIHDSHKRLIRIVKRD
jgi:F420-non-reducing hydrogenase large subunit